MAHVGRYEVLETLGQGGMGVVYRAHDPELDREVAIKLVLSWAQFDSDALARFKREARLVAQLRHRHIVTVFDAGHTVDSLPYFVMEYLEGTDLGGILSAQGPLRPARAIRYLLQVCDGLGYAHARDIVHRDIKPANLFVTRDDQIKIVDFGIAKLIGARITGSGVSLGTPLYMAPEQLGGGEIDARTDIFAVGGVLFTLLCGRAPFEAATLGAICSKIERENPPRLDDFGVEVSPDLEALIIQALEKDPNERFQSAEETAGALRDALESIEAGVAPTVVRGPRKRTPRPQTSAAGPRRARRALVTLAVVVVMAATALWVWPNLSARRGSDAITVSRSQVIDQHIAVPDPGPPPEEDATGDEDGIASPDTGPTGREESGGEPEPPATEPSRPAPADEGVIVEGHVPVEIPPTFYPASTLDRDRASRAVGELVGALQEKDPAALARLFGGSLPAYERRLLEPFLAGPRARIRYTILEVSSASDGTVLAEVGHDILFLGAPGTAPPPRTGVWIIVFASDARGGLTPLSIQPQ